MDTFFEVWNSDRTVKKAFVCKAQIKDVVAKANAYGIVGNKIVLENSGSEICEDEILVHVAAKNSILMLLNDCSQWTPNAWMPSPSFIDAAADIILHDEMVPQGSRPRTSNPNFFVLDNQVDSSSLSSSPRSVRSVVHLNDSAVSTPTTSRSVNFVDFSISWENLPADVLDKLEKKQRLGNRLHAFIKEVVKELRRISSTIPVNVLRGVATTVIAKYPDSFVQKDKEDRVVSNSLELLITMMRNHNNYLNSGSAKNNDMRVPIRKRKAVNALRNSVKNWSPAMENNEHTTLEAKQSFLKGRYSQNPDMSDDREKILLYMEDCFPAQRSYFNNQESYPSIELIKTNWPYIFTRECIYKHFSQLTETNFQKLLRADFTSEKASLAKFFSKKNEAALEDHQEMEILNRISHHFKENLDFLIQSFPIGKALDDLKAPVSAPWIAVVDISYVAKTAYIFIEQKIVWSSETPNIFDILAQTIAYFYAFNIEYPKEVSQTLDFFVRFVLNFYPEKPRGPKKNATNLTKINNLIRKLNQN